jgi:hypothetical protein
MDNPRPGRDTFASLEGGRMGLFKKTAQDGATLTGPDYLIGAADELIRGNRANPYWAEVARTVAADVSAFKNVVTDRVMEGDGIGMVPDLTPRELAAMIVFREAVAVALQRQDRQSIEELSMWGVATVLDFVRDGPADPLPPPP